MKLDEFKKETPSVIAEPPKRQPARLQRKSETHLTRESFLSPHIFLMEDEEGHAYYAAFDENGEICPLEDLL